MYYWNEHRLWEKAAVLNVSILIITQVLYMFLYVPVFDKKENVTLLITTESIK